MKKEIGIGNLFGILLVLGCIGEFTSCTSTKNTKQTAKPVVNFNPEMYLGDWYEIARFDFMWEKNLKNVKANYSLNENGSIKVTNSGFDFKKNEPKKVIGKAKIRTNGLASELKVSFFGPFYSNYTIIAIDSNYQYALVAGENTNYLWFLSRTPTMPEQIKQEYVKLAQSYNYNLQSLVWTVQE